MTVANNCSYRDSRSRHQRKGIHHGNHMPYQSSTMCHIFLLKNGRCLKSPRKWMIVTCHSGGRKSEINHGVNTHWNGHFRETQEFPSHERDKVNSWVTTRVYKILYSNDILTIDLSVPVLSEKHCHTNRKGEQSPWSTSSVQFSRTAAEMEYCATGCLVLGFVAHTQACCKTNHIIQHL